MLGLALAAGAGAAVSPVAGAIGGISGEDAGKGREIALDFEQLGEEPFVVRTNALQLRLTCVHFCHGAPSRVLPARDDGERRSPLVPHRDRRYVFAAVPVPPGLPAGLYRASLEALPESVSGGDGSPRDAPAAEPTPVSIPPVPSDGGVDGHVAALRRRYVGTTVQGFGDLTLSCDPPYVALPRMGSGLPLPPHLLPAGLPTAPPNPQLTVDVGRDPSLVVSAIDRPAGPNGLWTLGGAVTTRYGGVGSFASVMPVRVRFAYRTRGAGAPLHGCRGPHLALADWEVERTLWIHAPALQARAEPAIGMSRIQVAHLLGYPDAIGTPAELDRLTTWHYPAVLQPFDSSVTFAHGRVAQYRAPQSPP